MKRVLSITGLILALAVLLAGPGWGEAKPGWTPVSGNENNMVVFGHVFLSGQKVSEPGYRLGAFGPGGAADCRAVGDIAKDGRFYLTIRGDRNGESVGFKVYDQRSEAVHDLAVSVLFKSDATVAGIDLH